MTSMTRKTFLGGLGAAFGSAMLPATAFAKAGKPIMRFGVASDVHVSDSKNRERAPHNLLYLEKTLRWFDRQGAEVVVFPGDIIDTGLISEFEKAAAVWHKVFPSGRASDGRRMEHFIVTGNHEVCLWKGRWDGISEEEQQRIRFDRHTDETMRRLFGEPYEPVFMRKFNGVAFVGAQYHSQRPPVEKFLEEHASEIPSDIPFFYVQHAHPQNTCYGKEARTAWDDGRSARALSRFPNAVALTGHSHNPLTDDRSVWQGAFTSIGCGCLMSAGSDYELYDNSLASYFKEYSTHRMVRVHGEKEFNGFGGILLIDVFRDRLVVRRWSPMFDEPLGPDWVVPVPAATGGQFDFARRAEEGIGKSLNFPDRAKVSFRVCRAGGENRPKTVGPRLRGKDCVSLRFPAASVGERRVFDYEVSAAVDGNVVAQSRILSKAHGLPSSRVGNVEEVCLFGLDEFPVGAKVVFTVTSRDCYGAKGGVLVADAVVVNGQGAVDAV